MRPHQRFDRGPPVRIHRGVGRDVEAELHVRRLGQLRYHQFEHAVIDQPDQAELLGDGDDVRRQQHLAVALLHPHQAFVEGGLPRSGVDHRLERHHDAPLVERGDDLVGDADIDPALGVALGIGTPQRERAGAAALGHVQGFLGAVDRLVGVARVARHADRADRRRHRNRTRLGRHHVIANPGEEALGRDIDVVDGAVLQDQSELVAREAAEHVAAAQPRADPARGFRNHRVRDIEAEGIVDARQMVDADQHEGERRPETCGLLDRLGQCRHQMGAVEFAGQRIVPRQPLELFVAGVALIVDADDALHLRRPAVEPGKPAAGFLDPEHRRGGRGAHAVFDAVGRAGAAMGRRRMAERVGPDRAHRLDQFGELRAAGQRRRRNIGKDRGGTIGPGDGVAGDIPGESGLAERGEDGGGLRNGRDQERLVSGHCRE